MGGGELNKLGLWVDDGNSMNSRNWGNSSNSSNWGCGRMLGTQGTEGTMAASERSMMMMFRGHMFDLSMPHIVIKGRHEEYECVLCGERLALDRSAIMRLPRCMKRRADGVAPVAPVA